MDNMNVTTKCITLSPEELAELDVNLDSLAPTASAHPKSNNVANAVEETPSTSLQDQKTEGINSKVKKEREFLKVEITTKSSRSTKSKYKKNIKLENKSDSLIMNNSNENENEEIPQVLMQSSLNNFVSKREGQKKLDSDKIAVRQKKPGRTKLNGNNQDKNKKSSGKKRQINNFFSSDSELDIPLSKISRSSDGKIKTYGRSKKTAMVSDSKESEKIDISDSVSDKSKGKLEIPTAISDTTKVDEPLVNELKSKDKLEIPITINDTTKVDEPLVNESISNGSKRKRGRPKKSEVSVVVAVESEEEISFTKSKKGRPRKEIDYSLLEESVPKSINSLPAIPEGSKYTFTGNTTLALKQIFSSFEGKNADDVSLDTIGRRKRGKCVIKDDVFSDEEGTLICAVCNETVINHNWIEHKQKVHYNLTWKKGETPIDLSDNSVILNAYEKLRKAQGFLKCKKCKKKCVKSKEFMLHLEMCNDIVKANGMVICAVCKKELAKNEWSYHKYKEHNNLAWREGDQELNLKDQEIVMRILNQLYKARKPLHCEKCKVQKKSVVGYLSHKSVCQKSLEELDNLKVSCKLCGQKMLPVSMDYHMKTHQKPEGLEQILDAGYFNVDVGTSGQRKAATRALTVIKSIKGELVNSSKYYTEQCDFEDDWVLKQLKKKFPDFSQVLCIFNNNNCEFKSDSLQNLIQHLNSCENKPEQYFVCKLCLAWTRDEMEIKNHVKTDHNKVKDEQDGEFNAASEGEECESDVDAFADELLKEKHRLRQNRKLLLTGANVVKVKPLFLVYPIKEGRSLFYPQAYPWMMNFCEKRYTNCYLFESFRNNEPYKVLDCDILDEYLPKLHESCDISVKELNVNDKLGDVEYRKLGLFEVSKSYKGESTIYCGGPIACLAWLPTPFQEENYDQILAVSVLNYPEKEYAVGETFSEPSVIQFWNCGQVHWQKDEDFNPYLLFGLALSTGPIWHMEWCPSGCLDLANNDILSHRLGLLAVATSDSYAYIYSIDNVKDENDKGLIYKGEPLVKLQLENVKTSNYYATKISWTKAKEHRYIAVGYTSGIVAIFDLLSTSTLWQKKNRQGTQITLPYLIFQAHVSCVTALSLCHYEGGNRWCFTAGIDKVAIFWDLSNMTKQMSNRKYGVSDGQFLTQWPVALCAEDETAINDTVSAHSFIRPIREVLSSEFCCFTNSPSGIKSVSFSDWLNLVLHGSNAGEVMGQFSHRMFFNIDKKQFKNSYIKCIFSVAKLISKNEDTTNRQCRTFEEAKQQYGIVFTDYNSDKLMNVPNSQTNNLKNISLDKLDICNYPLQAVTKVAANPNPQACNYWASGYQAGFVRIRQIELLKKSFNPIIFVNYDFSKIV